MKRIYYLIKVSVEKSFKDIIRYKFNTISDILSFYILFIALFFGMKFFGSAMEVTPIKLGETLEGFVAGYFLWTIMYMAYSDTAYSITNDANKGTLEQISMSHMGLHNIIIVRSLTDLAVNLLICFAVLFSIMATTNYWLNINIFELIILIILGIFSILGIGLIFGGLALIFKKIQSLLNIVQYFLIGIVITGAREFESVLTWIMPFRAATEGIYRITIGEESILNFSVMDISKIIVNSAVYFIVGLFIFNQCSLIAKKRGLLGQY